MVAAAGIGIRKSHITLLRFAVMGFITVLIPMLSIREHPSKIIPHLAHSD